MERKSDEGPILQKSPGARMRESNFVEGEGRCVSPSVIRVCVFVDMRLYFSACTRMRTFARHTIYRISTSGSE